MGDCATHDGLLLEGRLPLLGLFWL